MRFLAFLIFPLLLACASTDAPALGARRTIDIAAESYVRLALEIDTHE